MPSTNKTIGSLLSSFSEGQAASKSNGSWSWYQGQVKNLRNVASSTNNLKAPDLIKDTEIPKLSKFPNQIKGQGSLIGKMILFQYDPKLKQTLPYYDMFPIGFPIEIYSDGYLMLNLHYLPLAYRAKLMDNLYSFLVNKKTLDEKSQLLISYKLLKNYSKNTIYKPTLKRYLFTHVKSQWNVILPTEWELAAFLPLQRFQKAGINTVYQDSVKIIKGQ